MSFKHPEILWWLFLLFIPILIHLFQWRRFQHTTFTNVDLLQNIQSNSRKSSRLKKWLLLGSRLGILGGMVLAFAQPYFEDQIKNALKPTELVVYLDNSFSMQAPANQSTLFVQAVQELVQHIDPKQNFSLFTNDELYKNIRIENNKNEILNLKYSSIQLEYAEILLKAQSLFNLKNNSRKLLVVISDFQNRLKYQKKESSFEVTHIQLQASAKDNIAIDTAWIEKLENKDVLEIQCSSQDLNTKNINIAIYNGDKVHTKATVSLKDKKGNLRVDLPRNIQISGPIQIEDQALSYDNQLYIHKAESPKIKILVLHERTVPHFLKRIYTPDEFELEFLNANTVQLSNITETNCVVLFQPETISNSLLNHLQTFLQKQGKLIFVPSQTGNRNSYNQLLGQANLRFDRLQMQTLEITQILFDHPFFNGVFERNIDNFNFPKAHSYYPLNPVQQGLLQLQNNMPFLVQKESMYVFCAPIDKDNSNFSNSSLIVPVFYKIGTDSFQAGKLYYSNTKTQEIDIPIDNRTVEVLQLQKDSLRFIPLQQNNKKYVRLQMNSFPQDGVFEVADRDQEIDYIALNHLRHESNLIYNDLGETPSLESVKEFTEKLKSENKIESLWKWFVIFALAFLLFEILIIKLFK
ncbi:MAG: BatA domain-containing protein [Flavobacteriaceae bacterium]|nr:BatA domain-containing protein [Flavobacteriaceae bacterium]